MSTVEATAILDAARRLFGLTDSELEKILADPEQMLAIANMLMLLSRPRTTTPSGEGGSRCVSKDYCPHVTW